MPKNKHANYEILNLIGYGLSKFGLPFMKQFGYKTKASFYDYIVSINIAESVGTVKNRQDLFDPFFDNGRKGWWQKGNAYIHRKIFIDSLFGSLDVYAYSKIVKLYIKDKFGIAEEQVEVVSPILKSKFKQLQITGQEAELFFINNYGNIDNFREGKLEDARLYGDGYDFQIEVSSRFFLAEIKGLRTNIGSIRFTNNEFLKAKEYKEDYALIVVSNLDDVPMMCTVYNPTEKLNFTRKPINSQQINYHTGALKWL